jgi:acid phosphatase
MKTFLNLILILIFALTFVNCSSNEIINLRIAKDKVKDYYESGKFNEELNGVIKEAEEKFSEVEIKKNSVVIFDVDETALNNYGLAKQMDFGYVYELNKKWNQELKAPAIQQVKKLYYYLQNKGAKVIFLTGRNFSEYEDTYKNLVQVGYTGFDTLITQREDEKKLNTQEFKSKKRTELTQKGYEIIGTVGDQWSDLEGLYTGIKVKIPNYLYLIN